MQLTTVKEPKKTCTEIIVGIDFGTTNSLISVFQDEKCVVIPQESGKNFLPSLIAVQDKNIIVGKEAKKYKNYIPSIKRIIATKENLVIPNACTINTQTQDPQSNYALTIGYASKIFSSLKKSAEKYLGHAVRNAVVTVPAYFDNTSRSAIKDAATISGLNVIRLLSEPTAAALFYGIDEKREEGKYVVYDLGGGTFDISILEFHRGIFKVSCSDGDDHLGGDDFDLRLMEHLIQKHELHLSGEEKVHFLDFCKEIKEELAHEDRIVRYFSYQENDACIDVTLEDFEKTIEKDIDRTIAILKRALRSSDIPVAEVDGVLLVGGSTKIGLIHRKISELFGKEKIISGINPETIVVMGAALFGSFLNGRNPEKIVLLDVLPLSLGIETLDGTIERIIMKDSPIPIRQSQVLTNAVDGQTSFKIHVLQGERELAKDNRSLAEFTLNELPSLPAGKARIEVTFSIDEDGILKVSAKELITGKIQEIEVNPHYGLNRDIADQMIRDSFANLEEDVAQRSVIEAQCHADRVLKVVRRAIKENGNLLIGNEAEKIAEYTKTVEASMEKCDSIKIRESTEELEKIVDPFLKRRLSFLFREMNLDLNSE
ncbi:hsp70 family protein [Neorickettsia helminthoeca str. Oregon]|uniref:Hsp70 family protein n=1 Tax=Neorickettsia helminthoeca str. Oregon TaxID=1286528 RepID=X5HJH8_9RICK|nr:Hsp70 family protein [Neorickettsia helminthoeca]AHX11239.1 hsp70 family protein [Neorickettsia helminthoeca str. Oregon]